jgi:DNA-binding response OmpR family regulator
MQVLIADDDRVSAAMLAGILRRWDFDVLTAADGGAAWELLREHRPPVAIVDWMMPTVDGPELCRRLRADERTAGTYVILLTSKDTTDDLIAGLDAGADDYVTKPFDRGELRARVQVGVRVATLQTRLREKVIELEQALGTITQLEGLLPICAYCKRIRADDDHWDQVETYIRARSKAEFSHGVCPTCLEKLLRDADAASP